QGELHCSRIVCRLVQGSETRRASSRRLAKRRRNQSSLRRKKIRMIGQVEHFPSELHGLNFSDVEEAGQGCIRQNRTRPEQAVVLQIPEGIWRGKRKGRRVEPAVTTLRMAVRITDEIGALVEAARGTVAIIREVENRNRGRQIGTGLGD